MSTQDAQPLSPSFWTGGLDARPLRLFGALLGLVVLYDLADRLRDFHAFYTDGGLLEAKQLPGLSPALWLHEPWQAAVVFAVGAIGALGLVAGRWTKWSSALSFIALHTIHQRHPSILDGGDATMRLCLFWSMFVDLRGGRRLIPALPVRLLQAQIVILHFYAGVNKNGSSWRAGTALYRSLQDVTFVRPWAEAALSYPALCSVLTYATLILEIGFPLFVLSPWRHSLVRAIGVGGATVLHLGIFALMRVGIFSFIMPVALVALWRADWIPSWRRNPPPDDPIPSSRRLLLVALPLFALILWRVNLRVPPRPVVMTLAFLGVDQRWSMFAPQPPHLATTWSFPGVTSDGVLVDVGELVPQLIEDDHLRYSRWAKIKTGIRAGSNAERRRQNLGRWLCRRWHGEHPDGPQLIELDFEATQQDAADPGEVRSAPTRTRVFHQPCARPTQREEQPRPEHEGDDGVE